MVFENELLLAGYYNERALPPLLNYVNLRYMAGAFIFFHFSCSDAYSVQVIWNFSISKPLSVTGVLLALVFVFTYKTRKYNTSFL